MTPSNWALCIIFAAFWGRCLRGCLLIAHVLHDWATLWPTTYHPAPPLGTTLLLCQQPLTPHSSILPAAHPSFIWLRRLLLATWWVDASKANSLAPLSPSLPPPSSLLSHSYCQRIYFNTNFCCHSCFYCKHFFAICFDLCDGCVVPLLLPLHPQLLLLLRLLLLPVLTYIQSSTACPVRALS